MSNASRLARAAGLLWTILAAAAMAADYKGSVRASGLPIPGATVTASQGGSKLTAYTDEAGEFTLPALAPGTWTVRVEMFGFDPVEKTVTAPAETPGQWELAMRKPPQTPAVPVNREALRNRLQMNRAAMSETLGAESPNVDAAPSVSAQDANESFLVSGSMSQGLRMEQQNIMLMMGGPGFGGPGFGPPGAGPGGIPGMAPPEGSPQQPGMMGHPGPMGAGGGPMVMMGPGGGMRGGPGGGMRGGPGMGPGMARGQGGPRREGAPPWMGERGVTLFGNRRNAGRESIRGSAFFSLNSSALDARPYSLTGRAIDKPDYTSGRFGFNLGGQLRIPKLIDSPDTFFFVNYMGARSSRAFDALSTVPNALERAGDFSQSTARGPVAVYDPATGLPFAGNLVPASRIDPAARALLDYIPLPNLPGAVQNFQFVTSVPQNSDNLALRVSRSLSRRDRLSAGFHWQQRYSETAQTFGFRDIGDGSGLGANAGWIHNFSSTLINSLRLDFSRNRAALAPFFAQGVDVAANLGIQGASREPANYGPPNLSFTNFGALSDGSASLRRDQAAGINEDVTWVHGKHTLRTGIGYRRNQFNTLTDENGRGSFTFTGLLTSRFDAGDPAAGTGFDMADFLLGLPQSASVRYGNSSMYFRSATWNGFVQDDWRVRSSLTLSLGLRYEYTQPVYEKYNRMANLDAQAAFANVAVVTPENAGPYSGAFPRGLIDPDKNNFAPRLAVAWRARKLLVRGGYGLYYNTSVYNTIAGRMGQQPPFAFSNSFSTTLASPLTLATGLLGLPSADITNTYATDRGYKVGYAQTWNAAVQTELPHSLIFEIGYLGTKGTRLDIQRLPNQAPPGSPADAENRRPIPYAAGFLWQSAEGNSVYHAAQARLTRRFRRGLSFNALYTYGKSIDNVSSFGDGRAVVAQNDKDLAAERGLSSFDQRHTFNTFFIATSPVGEGPGLLPLRGLAAKLLRSWTLTGGATATSGTPLTASILGNRADAGGTGVVGSSRADATGLPVDAGAGLFNTAAFTLPPAGRYGNAGRNTIPGPGRFVVNLSFGRSFTLGERRHLEFRWEANNALNTVGYSRYGTTVNASNYGLPTAAGSMRTMNAQLRFRF